MWYKNSEKNKVLILLRGISGSGKSTLANQIIGDGQIFSTDDYWIQDGEYKFNSEQLGAAHQWNQNRAIRAMEQGVSPIIIDNTIVSAWEAKEYVKEAIERGYRIEILEPNTPWKFDAEELAKRNKHDVPLEKIQEMIDRWEHDITIDDILNSKSPLEED